MVSEALYIFTPAGNLHNLEQVITLRWSDQTVTHNSALCLSSLCLWLVPIWHLGMVKQVRDLRRHAQHLHQVVLVVGIEPQLPAQKPCFLTTTLPWPNVYDGKTIVPVGQKKVKCWLILWRMLFCPVFFYIYFLAITCIWQGGLWPDVLIIRIIRTWLQSPCDWRYLICYVSNPIYTMILRLYKVAFHQHLC